MRAGHNRCGGSALFHRTFETRVGRGRPGFGIECRIGHTQRRHLREDMVLDRFDAWWSGLRYVRRSVVLRLLGTVLVFSCAITLILTAVQLYRDYERGIAQIQNRLVDIDRSYRDSLGEALWQLDQPQVKLELEGMLRLADIRAAQVRELPSAGTAMVVAVGEQMTVAREFPILYRVQDKVQPIDTLYV